MNIVFNFYCSIICGKFYLSIKKNLNSIIINFTIIGMITNHRMEELLLNYFKFSNHLISIKS